MLTCVLADVIAVAVTLHSRLMPYAMSVGHDNDNDNYKALQVIVRQAPTRRAKIPLL